MEKLYKKNDAKVDFWFYATFFIVYFLMFIITNIGIKSLSFIIAFFDTLAIYSVLYLLMAKESNKMMIVIIVSLMSESISSLLELCLRDSKEEYYDIEKKKFY